LRSSSVEFFFPNTPKGSETMGEKIDKFTNDLREQLTTADNRLNDLKNQVESAGEESRDAIQAKIDQAKSALEEQKSKAEEGRQRVKSYLEADLAETNQDVHDWKQKRELHKLDKRAERRENYAADAIFIAAAAIDEANVAFLEALEARLDAEEAHGAAGA
jgi:predicted  nucleic acid-binding Zn-ribbon protein